MHDARLTHRDRLGWIIRHVQSDAGPSRHRTAERGLRLGSTIFGQAFASETGAEPWSSADDHEIARCVFFQSSREREDQEGSLTWYQANASLFLRYAPVACRLLDPDISPSDVPHFVMLWDALHLLQRHNARLGAGDVDYGHGRSGPVPFAALFHQSRRLLSVRSTDVNVGAAVIALAIESRLRSMLGPSLLGRARGRDLAGRIPMWRIFKALADFRPRLELAVELGLLVAVYNWASHYRHAGLRSYAWLNYFAHDLLAPLFDSDFDTLSLPEECLGIEGDRETLPRFEEAVLA